MPSARTDLARPMLWWSAGIIVTALCLALQGPATTLHRTVTDRGITWPEHLADVLVFALMALFVAAVAWPRGPWRERFSLGFAAGVGVLVSYGSSTLLKAAFSQQRPCHDLFPDPLCPAPDSWSFPSNHATIAFALATAAAVVLAGRWWGWIVFTVALVIAVSRVVDGVHFPHDVAAGAALGVCTTMACALLLRQPVRSALERVGRRGADSTAP